MVMVSALIAGVRSGGVSSEWRGKIILVILRGVMVTCHLMATLKLNKLERIILINKIDKIIPVSVVSTILVIHCMCYFIKED